MKLITTTVTPSPPYEKGAAYFFPANQSSLAAIGELTNRTLGWFNQAMIDAYTRKRVASVGAGGIGGNVDESLARAGIGELVIADSGFFDYSNIHRQFGATTATVGASKTFATIELLNQTVNATAKTAVWEGLTPETAAFILEGADIAGDSIEYHALGARYLMHKTAHQLGVPILNGNSVGFGTNLFMFHPEGAGLTDILPFNSDYAYELEHKIAAGTITAEEYEYLCLVIDSIFLPQIPNYGGTRYNTKEAFLARLKTEKVASIVTTNPKMAAGIMADNILLYLVQDLEYYENVRPLPVFPEYYHYDAAFRISETRLLDIKKIKHELNSRLPRRY